MSTVFFLLAILALLAVRLWAAFSVQAELDSLPAAERARMQRALNQAI